MIRKKTLPILHKLMEYNRIILFRHQRIDGDCVGATQGLKAILKATWPEKEVLIIDDERSEYLAFLGENDPPIPDEHYRTALGVVIDTGNEERISNPRYKLCREVIKIDHHIPRHPYGDLQWVEEERSAACEMIAAFWDAHRDVLKMTSRAATFLYTGMVTDSGRFQYEGVSGDTMRYAGMLLDQGVDTQTLYAHLYLKDFDSLKFRAYVYEQMKITEHGVAYVIIDKAAQERFGLSFESACTAISYMDSIRDCLCWLAFIDAPDGSIRVRLRSRFMTVDALAERYRGGGHACASGATLLSPEEIPLLVRDADDITREYKETHEGWL